MTEDQSADEEQNTFTTNVLINALHSHAAKLKHGSELRDEIHEALASGVEPNHYRVEWIKDSVVQIFGQLEEIAREFNRNHPEDRCSTEDYNDILASALATLRSGNALA